MRRLVHRLGKDEGAAAAPIVALSLVGLIAVGGLAFDYARLATLDTELQSAADHAAISAASQLDGEAGACDRAVKAALNVVSNETRLANDGGGLAVAIAYSGVCQSDGTITDDINASIRFFQNKLATIAATDNSNARFVEVRVNNRKANYALTPIVGVLTSGDLSAKARAGLGTALCKVPPLMICPPAGTTVDWDAMRGKGIRAVSQSGNTWSPGNFGYIGPQDANSTQKGLAFENPVFQCQEISGSEEVSTGSPTPAITALNTRFDVYDMSGGAGNVLTPCLGSSCPPALNVTKDVINVGVPSGGNSCKIQNSGWRLPTKPFSPRAKQATDTAATLLDSDGVIDAMGLPRDSCHYTSYTSACPGSDQRFGDGSWARADYFNKYHPGTRPTNWQSISRYDTYLWEIARNQFPSDGLAVGQRSRPVCNATTPDATRDRRVVQVAVGSNCSQLRGASRPVQVSTWVNMFLVEPGIPGRGNGSGNNEIYLEVIGEVKSGGPSAQVIRRDTPYLVR